MPFIEAIRLALQQIRVQKLKSFFTLVGVTISVMFLIAVVSIVQGMSKYVEEDFAGKFLGVNTFNVRRFPDINTDETEDTWRMWRRRPPILEADGIAIRDALPEGARWAIQDVTWADAELAVRVGWSAGPGAGRHPRSLRHQGSRHLQGSRVHRAGRRARRAGGRDRHRDRRALLPESRSDRARAPREQVSLSGDRRAREAGDRVRLVARPAGDRALSLAHGAHHRLAPEHLRCGRAGSRPIPVQGHRGDRARSDAQASPPAPHRGATTSASRARSLRCRSG